MKYLLFPISALTILSLTACDLPNGGDSGVNEKLSQEAYQAIVKLQPVGDSNVRGNILFEQGKNDDEVSISGEVFGLDPSQKHAFHVHEKGDCGNNGENAGGHFNPDNTPHGEFDENDSHAGDFPQLEADSDGNTEVDFDTDHISLIPGDEHSVIGRALIVHEKEDKFTQPSGDAGDRIACGIIEKK